MYRRRLSPCAALGWARQQWTQGHLPYYNPLLIGPAVCSRLKDQCTLLKYNRVTLKQNQPTVAFQPGKCYLIKEVLPPCVFRWPFSGPGGGSYLLYGVLCDPGWLCCRTEWRTPGLYHPTEQHHHCRRKDAHRHALVTLKHTDGQNSWISHFPQRRNNRSRDIVRSWPFVYVQYTAGGGLCQICSHCSNYVWFKRGCCRPATCHPAVRSEFLNNYLLYFHMGKITLHRPYSRELAA